ncbi:copper amine oxidase N-terminal domain-containing protein [Paenibacillus tarimensis]|uniref:copper amine oxidase N-terminal domain-containing protein n=1 Tax=Paenibacillus tarimensis TaxID=416012 RepID=UPI001F1F6D64|nr:copper amine oxidase N-terminal domain-containing protein [Paenibacillus tarimensis]MCF2944219.1 copper amine oxidase N-terminal domain-containing protein [Paenibacillus tarimensis]
MKRTKLHALAVIWICCMLVGGSASVSAASSPSSVRVTTTALKLVFDGKTLKLPEGQYLFMVKGSAYVPIRFVSYALLKQVTWNAKDRSVRVEEPDQAERKRLIGYLKDAAVKDNQAAAKGGANLSVIPVEAKFAFMGDEKRLAPGQQVYSYKGTLYVPVRFMSESAGVKIVWDSANKRITGYSDAYRKGQNSALPAKGTGSDSSSESGGASGGVPVTSKGSDHGGASGGTSGGGTPGGGAPGGGGAVDQAYTAIVTKAEKRLTELQNACQADMTDLFNKYLKSESQDERNKLLGQGEELLGKCTEDFEVILSETKMELESGGFSTAILEEYRRYFEEMVSLGKALVKMRVD